MTEPTRDLEHPFTILIAALGGEGGSVLMNWIVAAARTSGMAVQATSVPGVAQRTGSTSYYIEAMRPAAGRGEPLFALVPMPGRVDVVLVSELVEAGRVLERGLVSPTRTTLITSTSRVYTTAEKAQMADGRFDPARIEAAGRALARRYIALDLDALARTHGTQVSATMLGALAGSGVLPWPRAQTEAAIGTGGSAESSRRGFAAAFEAVTRQAAPLSEPQEAAATAAVAPVEGLPPAVAAVAALGRDRCAAYQDALYGDDYLVRVRGLAAAARAHDPVTCHALEEAARRLATWMTYEDIPRVAELKTLPGRFAGIRREAEMADGQILHVTEYLKPGADEIAAILPRRLGERLERRIARGKSLPLVGRGIHVRSTGVVGYAMLRALARLKKRRRGSLRFHQEQTAIEAWLEALRCTLPAAPAFASALAELPRLRKGYAETQVRGRTNYDAIFSQLVMPLTANAGKVDPTPADTKRLRSAMAAALADPNGETLARLLRPGS